MRSLLLALAAVALMSPAGHAAQPAPAAVSAWVAVPAAGATSAAAYVEVSNPTMYEIYITAASSDVAPTVELRAGASSGDGAVVPEFPVPAFGGTTATVTAPHLRLVGLTRPLAAGDTVQLTLKTDGGTTLTIAAPVRQP